MGLYEPNEKPIRSESSCQVVSWEQALLPGVESFICEHGSSEPVLLMFALVLMNNRSFHTGLLLHDPNAFKTRSADSASKIKN